MAFLDKTAKARELQRRRSRSRERQSGEPAGGAAGAHEQAPNDPASSHEEPSGHPAKDAAVTKKSRDVTFNDDHFLIFADVLAGHTAATAVEVGGLLGVKPGSMKLWTSFLGYALLSAKDKSGLGDNRFPDAAKRALEFTNVDEYMEELLRQQDTLHAPARTRARQAVSLFAALEKVAASSGAWQEEATKRLWHLFFFLQMSNVYAGEVSFIEKFIFADGFDGKVFSQSISAWVLDGHDSVMHVTQDRLKFAALTRKEVNCRYNPRDGRRHTGSCATCALDADDCQEDQREVVAAEEDSGVDRSVPAPHLPPMHNRGLARLAYRSRWLDTMIDAQPAWWMADGSWPLCFKSHGASERGPGCASRWGPGGTALSHRTFDRFFRCCASSGSTSQPQRVESCSRAHSQVLSRQIPVELHTHGVASRVSRTNLSDRLTGTPIHHVWPGPAHSREDFDRHFKR